MQTASFPIELGLPEGNPAARDEAAKAIHAEYLNSVQVKRLRAQKVEASGPKAPGIYRIEVGPSAHFDWSWEGAVAFRPSGVDELGAAPNPEALADYDPATASDERSGTWFGEVVEVDQTRGHVFVNINESGQRPTTGSFFVKPFEFLTYLDALYQDAEYAELRTLLPARLRASEGGIHPPIAGGVSPSRPDLTLMWSHAWSILWGPPGTGKTYTIGRQLAEAIRDPSERLLVVSTTNAATDEAALSIGTAMRDFQGKGLVARFSRARKGGQVAPVISRIGKGAGYRRYADADMEHLLRDTEADILSQIAALQPRLKAATRSEEKALVRRDIQDLRRKMTDTGRRVFKSPDIQVVVTTAFNATRLLTKADFADYIAAGVAPFTTIVIDEAGLLSRATVAALSLLAAKRVMLVGDPRQLAPISKVSRVLTPVEARWLARSGLNHLDQTTRTPDAVHLMRQQHRMHPHIRAVVSKYQYEGALDDADDIVQRKVLNTPLLETAGSRAVWYVLDEDSVDLKSIRAQRGPGNRSWIRPGTRAVLDKLFADKGLLDVKGLFLSPFAAQARDIGAYLHRLGAAKWSAGTVHSQQGVGVDVVVFDTVNAGSCGWPYEEWKRIINVGLSRAEQFALLIASRDEMREPYLRPLVDTLSPHIITGRHGLVKFSVVPAQLAAPSPAETQATYADSPQLGHQLELRKVLRPLMSYEQQQLVNFILDGKPRLVRGVAGSGKTVVLANWLEQVVMSLKDKTDASVWAVFANRSLESLIKAMIDEAWQRTPDRGEFPWQRVRTLHVRDVMSEIGSEIGLGRMAPNDFDYESRANRILGLVATYPIAPRCAAMFIDEAQDMGMDTLKLLAQLVEQSDRNDPKSRAIHVFYDNAQNIYHRGTPTWSEIGLDMRGRSFVMKESFRSTRPIAELALNVLYRLQPPDNDPDYRELLERNLVERTTLAGADWWVVRFNQVEGPAPVLHCCQNWEVEMNAIASQILRWVQEEAVSPRDVVVICNQRTRGEALAARIQLRLGHLGTSFFASAQELNRSRDSVLVSTPHSFKGYDSEIVIVAGVDDFTAERGAKLLANNLYVAMTRARSALHLYGALATSGAGKTIIDSISDCADALAERGKAAAQISPIDDFDDLVEQLGAGHREWLAKLVRRVRFVREPLLGVDGEIVAEPAFWFSQDGRTTACFVDPPKTRLALTLNELGIRVIRPGEDT